MYIAWVIKFTSNRAKKNCFKLNENVENVTEYRVCDATKTKATAKNQTENSMVKMR